MKVTFKEAWVHVRLPAGGMNQGIIPLPHSPFHHHPFPFYAYFHLPSTVGAT